MYTYDVRKILGIFYSSPLIRISRKLSVLLIRKIRQFLNPTPPFCADVICTWSLKENVHRDIIVTQIELLNCVPECAQLPLPARAEPRAPVALVEVDHEEEGGAVQRPLDEVLEAEVGQADLKLVSDDVKKNSYPQIFNIGTSQSSQSIT